MTSFEANINGQVFILWHKPSPEPWNMLEIDKMDGERLFEQIKLLPQYVDMAAPPPETVPEKSTSESRLFHSQMLSETVFKATWRD